MAQSLSMLLVIMQTTIIIYSQHVDILNITLPTHMSKFAFTFYQNELITINGKSQNKPIINTYSSLWPNNSSLWSNILDIKMPSSRIEYASQSYTQINNILFGVPRSNIDFGSYLFKYNLDTNEYIDPNSYQSNVLNTTDSACVIGSPNSDKLYIIGGYYLTFGTTYNLVQIYDIVKDTWSFGSQLNKPRRASGCAFHHNHMFLYIFGGILINDEKGNDIEKYDVLNNSWSVLNETMYIARSYHKCLNTNNYIYCIGGNSKNNDLIEVFRIHDEHIVTLEENIQLNIARYQHGIVKLSNYELLVLGGLDTDSNYLNSIEQVHLPVYPTAAPTESPSYSPTASPTFIPSTAPTIIPTQSPTQTPLLTPSNSPSSAPTITPSYSPIQHPSVTPTTPPSISPTITPTAAPSDAPTMSPTACVFDNMFYSNISHDGQDVRNVISITVSVPQYNHSNHSVAYFENVGYKQNAECTNDVDICHIKCIQIGPMPGCVRSSFVVKSVEYLSQLIIECTEDFSCEEATLKISNSEIENITINCDGEHACSSMNMRISNSIIHNISLICDTKYACNRTLFDYVISEYGLLNIHCVDRWSCDSMNIHLLDTSNADATAVISYNTSINCYDYNSCDNMWINADNFVNITMLMMKHSTNVDIIHPNTNNVHLVCWNVNEKLFVRYNTYDAPSEKELIDLGMNKFNGKPMPCHGINIDCTNNKDFPRECVMKYSLNQLNIPKFTGTIDEVFCYWLELQDIFSIECAGRCFDSADNYLQYDKSIDFDIIFDTTKTNESILFEKCVTFFGEKNDTENTLDFMNAIFLYALNVMAGLDSFKINDILQSPETLLRDEVSCDDTFQIVRINVQMSIQSGIQDKKEFDGMFNDKSVFVTESQKLLTELFDIPVSLNTLINTTTEWKDEFIGSIIGVGLFLILVMILTVYIKRKRRLAIESMTEYIERPMVLAVAIGKYNNNATTSGCHFPELEAIDRDIQNLLRLFRDTLHYQDNIFPDYNQTANIKTNWNKNEIINFLEERASYLNENQSKFDALVVIISCHGIEDFIITSDCEKINKDTIHEIFSFYPTLRNIPRIFIHDCCDGYNDVLRDTNRADVSLMSFEIDEPSEEFELTPSNKSYKNIKPIWCNDESNPNYKLVIVNSSNKGFKSQMGTKSGSFMINKFVDKMIYNINQNDNKLFLNQVLHQVQEDLHNEKKQLPEIKYNNKLEYIKFKPYKYTEQHVDKMNVEMIEIQNQNNRFDNKAIFISKVQNKIENKKGQMQLLQNTTSHVSDVESSDNENIPLNEDD